MSKIVNYNTTYVTNSSIHRYEIKTLWIDVLLSKDRRKDKRQKLDESELGFKMNL